MTRRKTPQSFLVVFACVLAGMAGQVGATALQSAAEVEFSGGAAPTGTPPWLTMIFNDHGGAGSVTVTLVNTNLTGDEFVGKWYLNLDPTLSPAALVFSAPTKIGDFTDPVISQGTDAFKADGDGYYDVSLAFDQAGGPAPSATRFDAGESVRFTVTGIPSLNAYSFDALSAPGGMQGVYTGAAHVQGIGMGSPLSLLNEGDPSLLSGWVGFGPPIIPEPATMSLLALAGFALIRRR